MTLHQFQITVIDRDPECRRMRGSVPSKTLSVFYRGSLDEFKTLLSARLQGHADVANSRRGRPIFSNLRKQRDFAEAIAQSPDTSPAARTVSEEVSHGQND